MYYLKDGLGAKKNMKAVAGGIVGSGIVNLETGLLTAQGEAVGSSALMSYAYELQFGKAGAAFISIAITASWMISVACGP